MTECLFDSGESLTLRRFKFEDARSTLRVFRDAVRIGAASHYSYDERLAWSPTVMVGNVWRAERLARPNWVAVLQRQVVGFVESTEIGEVTMLYVSPDFTRRGIGSALLKEAEQWACQKGCDRVCASASLVAESLFMRAGYVVLRQEWTEHHGIRLRKLFMEKFLESQDLTGR